ncbi:ATP-binding protein [Celeribacter sp.]|uniref:ATP-binding protein n=1 Tax=Celeribacter sp. TaxID=1890673 RepID=UPI003A8D1C1C
MSSQTSIKDLAFHKRLVFTATDTNVRRGLRAVFHSLRDMTLAPEEAACIELVLAEALNNIVEHAYTDTPDGLVEICVSRDAKGLSFQISDRGKPMPGGQPPLGIRVLDNTGVQDLPEGGFGWLLIRELANDLDYRREGNTNMFSFRINVAAQNESCGA